VSQPKGPRIPTARLNPAHAAKAMHSHVMFADGLLAGFGKFKVKASPEREGRNPANGEKIKIAASRKLSFSPAKAVKDSLNA
jgi:hypothetical protein